VVFVVDTSIFIDQDKLQMYVIGVIRDIVAHLQVDAGRTRVAAISFSNTAKVPSRFFIFFKFLTLMYLVAYL